MDAKKCLEIAKGWLELAEEEDDWTVKGSQLAFAKAWLDAGNSIFKLAESLRYQEEYEKWRAKENKDVDGPAEGEDG